MFIKRRNRFHTKKGAALVEAAIFLPVFFLAILSIAALIRLTGVQENIMTLFAEEAARTAKEAYLTQLEVIPDDPAFCFAEGAANGALLTLRVRERLDDEERLNLKSIRLKQFRYLYSSSGINGLIRADLLCNSTLPLPGGFSRDLVFEEHLLYRGFIGSEGIHSPMEYAAMEEEQHEETVYVFPRAGERYHDKNCGVIAVCAHRAFLTDEMKRKYSPCKLCDPDESAIGSIVYFFPKSGGVYHRENCTLVERYVVEMEKEEAIEKGYTPCMLCGG